MTRVLRTDGPGWASALLCALLSIGAPAAGRAQAPPPPVAAAKLGPDLELRGVEDTIDASNAQRKKLETEIEVIHADRARLNAALIETAANAQNTETKIASLEQQLQKTTASEDAIRRSLAKRRDVIAQVLAALQRMGRRPAPAVLVSPDDMLKAVRTSMLLSAVVPELRADAEALGKDLTELVRLRQTIVNDRAALQTNLASLEADHIRLEGLVKARQAALKNAQQALDAERQRAGDLAAQAQTLKDLIARMAGDNAASAQAQSESQKAEAARRQQAQAESDDVKARAAAPFQDPARLAPQIAFADAKGMLPLPVSGTVLKQYGAADGFGGAEKGLSLTTQPKAIVSSPTDGWVEFSGPYRSYGQVLIINAGNGYYVVLAGMERINVDVSQFVLAGEPVATMGSGAAQTASAISIGSAEPVLYVEFRKDGAAIDPGPWWVKPDREKVRG